MIRSSKKTKLCSSSQVQTAKLPKLHVTSSSPLSSASASSETRSTLGVASDQTNLPHPSSSATLVGLSSQSSKKRQRISSSRPHSASPSDGDDDKGSLLTLDEAIGRALASDCDEDAEISRVKAVRDKEVPVPTFRPAVLPAGYVSLLLYHSVE